MSTQESCDDRSSSKIVITVKDKGTGNPITTAKVCISAAGSCGTENWEPVDANGEYFDYFTSGPHRACAKNTDDCWNRKSVDIPNHNGIADSEETLELKRFY